MFTVYTAPAKKGKMFKVGFSENPIERMDTNDDNVPINFDKTRIYSVGSKGQAKKLEAAVHAFAERFRLKQQYKRSGGKEWFNQTCKADVDDFLAEITNRKQYGVTEDQSYKTFKKANDNSHVIDKKALDYVNAIKPIGKVNKKVKVSDAIFSKPYPKAPKSTVLFNTLLPTHNSYMLNDIHLAVVSKIPQPKKQRVLDDKRVAKLMLYLAKPEKVAVASLRIIKVCKVLSDNSCWILDGNTRLEIWHRERLKAVMTGVESKIYLPETVNLEVLEVETLEDMKKLYSTFNNKNAQETTKDLMGGAIIELGHGEWLENPALCKHDWKQSIQNIREFAGLPKAKNSESEEEYLITQFKQELQLINDKLVMESKLNNSFIMAAVGLLYGARGNNAEITKIIQYLTLIALDEGDITRGRKDAIYFVTYEYSKARSKREAYFPKSTAKSQIPGAVFGFWVYYYVQWKNQSREKKVTDTSELKLSALGRKYLK